MAIRSHLVLKLYKNKNQRCFQGYD